MASLVQKIPFDADYKRQITLDIGSFKREHRTNKMEIISNDSKQFIQITTPMELENEGDGTEIQFIMQVNETYPSEAPKLLFLPGPGQCFEEDSNLQADGTINISGIFEWDSELTLNDIYDKIKEFFSNKPPISKSADDTSESQETKSLSAQSSSEDFMGTLMNDANDIITECNTKSNQLHNLLLESAMLTHLKTVLDQIEISNPNSEIKEVDKYVKPNIYPIQEAYTRSVELRAKELASQKTIDAYKKAYENDPTIDINMFIKEYRDMCNSHFKAFVWPQIKE